MYKATEDAKKWMERKPYEQKEYNLMPYELRDISLSVELITPEKSKEFLDRMGINRHIHQDNANRLKNDLVNNRFTFCPSPIIFNNRGELIDGQHRCKAAVDSGKSFWGIILYNVPDDIVIDRGTPRSISEELYMRGVIDKDMSNPIYTSIVRSYLSNKYGHAGRAVSDSQVGEFINDYSDSLKKAYSASYVGRTVGGNNSVPCKKSGVMAAFFAALECGVKEDTLRRFAQVANSGFPHSDEEYAAVVLNKYLGNYINSHGGQKKRNELTMVTENAIKDFVMKFPRKKAYSNPEHIYINRCPAVLRQGR